jgi:hypothetical protein
MILGIYRKGHAMALLERLLHKLLIHFDNLRARTLGDEREYSRKGACSVSTFRTRVSKVNA